MLDLDIFNFQKVTSALATDLAVVLVDNGFLSRFYTKLTQITDALTLVRTRTVSWLAY